MVKLCVICGNVDGVDGVSLHRFPVNDQQRRQWVLFVENCGINAQRIFASSKLCSRHFILGRDYRAETNRRRLLPRVVPSLVVQPVLETAAPDDELEADVAIEMEIEAVEVQVEEVMMDLAEEALLQEHVVQDDIEYVDLLPADAEAEFEFRDALDVLLPDVNEEFVPIPPVVPRACAPFRYRPAGIQHELPERHDIGPLNVVCQHCGARHFSCERTSTGHFSTCCNNGQMAVTGDRVLGPPPELLIRLLVDDSQVAKHFRKEIRRYNNTLAFAAFSTDLSPRRLPGQGPRVFSVHGQVYRRISNDVVRNELMQPRYCELYFIESGAANQIRMAQQPRERPLLENLLADLDRLLRRINPFAVAFENMRQVWQREQDAAAANPMLQPKRVTMHIVADPNNDPRRYNQPAAHVNEVAVVFVGEDGLPPGNLDLVIYDSNPVDPNHRMQSISAGSPHADPMLYPMLFPHGETGWHYNLQQEGVRRNAVRVRNSIREFASSRLAIRYTGTNSNGNEGHTFSLLHAGGFLLQQYICDQYVRVEANNLRYIRDNQKALFADAYQGLLDHINQQLHLDEIDPVGRRTILPSTFLGVPRYMKQCYHDAMSIVRKYGKPDLFITFTCNPRWPEIVDNIPCWLKATDRPYLVARVFHAKLKELMRDITINKVFGNVDAYVYTIEFQKRGLPHAHILIILDEDSKLLTVDDVDSVVCAYLPDPASERRLLDSVKSHMIHGPCGPLNRNSPCMVDSSCTKKYPKEYSEETVYISDGGYPTYRRPNNGLVVNVRGHPVGNEFVVPYNPYLLVKYDAHINVEVCSTVKSVMYLYKYVYKGHDAATLEVWNGDEIENYINSRYVSPPEAVWRLFSYEMHNKSHTIIRLPVHQKDYHNVYFGPGQVLERVQDAALARTKLTAFFNLNVTDVEARQYLYQEIPIHYTWNASRRTWSRRRRRMTYETLARMYVVNPLDRDRFYLRLLLLHKRGPQSFRDMKKVDGVEYPTYAAAAVAMGLVEDDRAMLACIAESATLDTPAQLRYLFVTMLLHCEITNPLALYQASEPHMMQDFNHRLRDIDRARAACLDAINRMLRGHGKSLADYSLPLPDVTLLEEDPDDDMFGAIDAAVRWAVQLANLNDEQLTVFNRVMAAVDDNRNISKLFYVDGPGGTGKTTLYGCLIWSLRNQGRSVLSVAFTGIAASLMDGGMTVHSTFGLPFGTLNDDSTSTITLQSLRAQRIRDAALIVWDEAPMSPGLQLTVVNRLLQDLMGSELPFGGKPVLFAGDFRQILPVVRRGTRSDIVRSSIKYNSLWRNLEQFNLTRNMRADNDTDFATWLLQLGSGQLPAVDGVQDTVEIPREMVCEVANLIDFVFPQRMSLANVNEFARKIILCPRNDECRQVNRTVLQRIDGVHRTYTAIDTVVVDDPDEVANYPTEFLNTLEPDGLPPYNLTLKVGSIVMLLRNLDSKRRFCNGTRLVVTELRRYNFKARMLSGGAQEDIVIPAVLLTSSGEDDLPIIMRRVQFPVRLSFGMTINKSQGQTFDRVGLLLPSPVFTHGQLYVAFSRVRDSQSMRVGMYSDDRGRFVTKNIVYREVLQAI